MRATFLMLGATTLALAPGYASSQTAPGNGQYNGNGYWHQTHHHKIGEDDGFDAR